MAVENNNNSNNKKKVNVRPNEIANLSSEELLVLATSISVGLTTCRSNCEIKAIINLVNLIEDNLIGILAQKNICAESIEEVFIE